MENNRNRNQSYQEDWYETDQGYDRNRDPNRYQRFANENRGGENYGNRGWQNTGGSGYSDMNRQYENRGNFDDDYNERGNWNQRNYGPNYRNRNYNYGDRN